MRQQTDCRWGNRDRENNKRPRTPLLVLGLFLLFLLYLRGMVFRAKRNWEKNHQRSFLLRVRSKDASIWSWGKPLMSMLEWKISLNSLNANSSFHSFHVSQWYFYVGKKTTKQKTTTTTKQKKINSLYLFLQARKLFFFFQGKKKKKNRKEHDKHWTARLD